MLPVNLAGSLLSPTGGNRSRTSDAAGSTMPSGSISREGAASALSMSGNDLSQNTFLPDNAAMSAYGNVWPFHPFCPEGLLAEQLLETKTALVLARQGLYECQQRLDQMTIRWQLECGTTANLRKWLQKFPIIDSTVRAVYIELRERLHRLLPDCPAITAEEQATIQLFDEKSNPKGEEIKELVLERCGEGRDVVALEVMIDRLVHWLRYAFDMFETKEQRSEELQSRMRVLLARLPNQEKDREQKASYDSDDKLNMKETRICVDTMCQTETATFESLSELSTKGTEIVEPLHHHEGHSIPQRADLLTDAHSRQMSYGNHMAALPQQRSPLRAAGVQDQRQSVHDHCDEDTSTRQQHSTDVRRAPKTAIRLFQGSLARCRSSPHRFSSSAAITPKAVQRLITTRDEAVAQVNLWRTKVDNLQQEMVRSDITNFRKQNEKLKIQNAVEVARASAAEKAAVVAQRSLKTLTTTHQLLVAEHHELTATLRKERRRQRHLIERRERSNKEAFKEAVNMTETKHYTVFDQELRSAQATMEEMKAKLCRLQRLALEKDFVAQQCEEGVDCGQASETVSNAMLAMMQREIASIVGPPTREGEHGVAKYDTDNSNGSIVANATEPTSSRARAVSLPFSDVSDDGDADSGATSPLQRRGSRVRRAKGGRQRKDSVGPHIGSARLATELERRLIRQQQVALCRELNSTDVEDAEIPLPVGELNALSEEPSVTSATDQRGAQLVVESERFLPGCNERGGVGGVFPLYRSKRR